MSEFETVDEYISQFPKDVQKILEELRKIIKNTHLQVMGKKN